MTVPALGRPAPPPLFERTPTLEEVGLELLVSLDEAAADLPAFQTAPDEYSRQVLKVEPWAGENGRPGQLELLRAIGDSVGRQLAGDVTAPRIFRVDSGHGVGKTVTGGILTNWAVDCFTPSITLTTAPTEDQVKLLLWKEVRRLRPATSPGRLSPSEPLLMVGPDHFAIGRTTSDDKKKGTHRLHGQHGPHMFFVVDEAEGVADFVFEAIDAMMTGGLVLIALLIANPQTRTSKFHKLKYETGVETFHFDALECPNVVRGRPVVPGMTDRYWVDKKIDAMCEPVKEHDPEAYTFSVPWRTRPDGAPLIYRPTDPEFLWRVRGIAPRDDASYTFVTPGRFEAAVARGKARSVDLAALPGSAFSTAVVGVDVARFGKDGGTVYLNHAGYVRRTARLARLRTPAYLAAVEGAALEAHAAGARRLDVRVDGTGGFGSGLIDALMDSPVLAALFGAAQTDRFPDESAAFIVREVNFGSRPRDRRAYANRITELYATAAEALRVLGLIDPPQALEEDLTERRYDYRQVEGRTVKALEEKEHFRKRHKDRSPDDGDGVALAAAPAVVFLPAAADDDLPPSVSLSSF